MRARSSDVGGRVEQVPGFEVGCRIGDFNIIPILNQPSIGFQLVGSQQKVIADAQFRSRLAGEESIAVPGTKVDYRIFGGAPWGWPSNRSVTAATASSWKV